MTQRARWLSVILAFCLAASGPAVAHDSASGRLDSNPFLPPAAVAAKRFKLRATLMDGSASVANINGKMYPLGARIDGFVIHRVGEGIVVLRRGKEELVLKVWAE